MARVVEIAGSLYGADRGAIGYEVKLRTRGGYVVQLVSVLTAVHPVGAGYLAQTRESVLGQELPAGWRFEWVIQEDGPSSRAIEQALSGDDRISYAANGAKFGPAVTRNLALARARGTFIHNLDADDLLLPGALATLLAAFSANPSIHWAVGQADDLVPDGSRRQFPPYMPLGYTEAGVVNDWASAHGGNWPIHCAGVMYRAASLRALGGWAAVPTDEDLVLFAALSELTDGWQDSAVTWLYRQHPAQVTRAADVPSDESARRLALQRVGAVGAAELRLTGTGEDDAAAVTVQPPMKSQPTL
jgi:glycosyltransferase involved in cell wall biosynthesis